MKTQKVQKNIETAVPTTALADVTVTRLTKTTKPILKLRFDSTQEIYKSRAALGKILGIKDDQVSCFLKSEFNMSFSNYTWGGLAYEANRELIFGLIRDGFDADYVTPKLSLLGLPKDYKAVKKEYRKYRGLDEKPNDGIVAVAGLHRKMHRTKPTTKFGGMTIPTGDRRFYVLPKVTTRLRFLNLALSWTHKQLMAAWGDVLEIKRADYIIALHRELYGTKSFDDAAKDHPRLSTVYNTIDEK